MKVRTKNIWKKVALILAGITAVGALAFGIKAIVNYTKNDLTTIHPTFEVGTLGNDGKYVKDEEKLYTKEAFQCNGLQVKPAFDSTVQYQLYFYDDLDNFVESSEVLTESFSSVVHDGYARIVITPLNDEDGKISLIERVSTYPKQLTVKVSKDQSIRYYEVFGNRMREVKKQEDARFFYKDIEAQGDTFRFIASERSAATSQDILSIEGYRKFKSNTTSSGSITRPLAVYEFRKISSGLEYIKNTIVAAGAVHNFDTRTTHIVVVYKVFEGSSAQLLTNVDLSTLYTQFELQK